MLIRVNFNYNFPSAIYPFSTYINLVRVKYYVVHNLLDKLSTFLYNNTESVYHPRSRVSDQLVTPRIGVLFLACFLSNLIIDRNDLSSILQLHSILVIIAISNVSNAFLLHKSIILLLNILKAKKESKN